jgi:hypothetical protein
MKVVEDTTVERDGLALMLEQFIGKTRCEEFLSSYLQEIQTIEAMLYSLWDERTLDAAVGAQLDVYGRIVGQARNTDEDDIYRRYIQGRIAANRASGKIPELLNIMDLITDDTSTHTLTEKYPASFYIRSNDFDTGTYTQASGDRYLMYPTTSEEITLFMTLVGDLISDAKGAGIWWGYLYSYRDEDETFTLSSSVSTLETSSAIGLANTSQTTGGVLSGVIEYG